MSFLDEGLRCELCNKGTAAYRPKLNRILCLEHVKELEVERIIYLAMAKSTEQLATDMLYHHQLTFSKEKIIAIMKTAANKSLTELEPD